MKELTIFQDARLGSEIECVDMKEIHEGLECKTDYSTWVKRKIQKYKLVQGVDYVKCSPNLGSGLNGGQNEIQYIFTVEKAKLICAQEGTDRGIQYASYLINRDEKLTSIEKNGLLSMKGILMQLTQCPQPVQMLLSECIEEVKSLKSENKQKDEKIENDRPKVDFADAIMADDTERDLTQLVMECLKFGNIQCLHPNAALREMQKAKIVYKTSKGVYHAYAEHKHLFREREEITYDKRGRKRARPSLKAVLNTQLRDVLVKNLNPEICPKLYLDNNNCNKPTKIREVQNAYRMQIGEWVW